MNRKVKVFAMYLPQFHQIPENDEFWGKGFTDWVTVKNARPLYEGHQQPRVPLNDNYYDLSVIENVLWQANLAKRSGIYGFGVYHYWFNNEKNLLTKPAEILRDSGKEGIKYFYIWDNGLWKRSWSNVDGNDWAPNIDRKEQKKKGPKILIPYILGSEPDWAIHYNYLRTHFLSDNYVKIDNMPLFCIYNYNERIGEMCDYFNKLALDDGFNGIRFIFRNNKFYRIPSKDYVYNYEPQHAGWGGLQNKIRNRIKKYLNISLGSKISFYDYDKIWRRILKDAQHQTNPKVVYGAFVGYDDSPRRGSSNSKIVKGASPQKFKEYIRRLVEITESQNKEFIFLTAWNEWGEGAYLEPDTDNGYGYTDALKEVLCEKK